MNNRKTGLRKIEAIKRLVRALKVNEVVSKPTTKRIAVKRLK